MTASTDRAHRDESVKSRPKAWVIYYSRESWWVRLRKGDVVRTVEAGPDRQCAEAVLQLMREGRR